MAVALAPGLSRKLKKVLESRTDTPDVLASLNTLSTFYTENTQQARRNLRSTIEKRSLSINHEFLLASEAAQQALDRVEEEVNALAECCDNYHSLVEYKCSVTSLNRNARPEMTPRAGGHYDINQSFKLFPSAFSVDTASARTALVTVLLLAWVVMPEIFMSSDAQLFNYYSCVYVIDFACRSSLK